MSLTTDLDEARRIQQEEAASGRTGQHSVYAVLSEEERAKGFVRPVRRAYKHSLLSCRVITNMGLELCETFARDPKYYGHTYCAGCQVHLPVADFVWIEEDGSEGPEVGS